METDLLPWQMAGHVTKAADGRNAAAPLHTASGNAYGANPGGVPSVKHFGCCRRHRRRCAFGYGEAAERAAAR